MQNQITIQWSEAEQMEKTAQATKERNALQYKKNTRRAKSEFFSRLGNDNFCLSDFYDSATMYGIESDDLLNELI